MKETRELHKRSRSGKNRNRGHSLVSVWKQLTRTWPLPGRDSPEREQGEIPGLVWEWLAGTGLIEIHHLDNFEVDFI